MSRVFRKHLIVWIAAVLTLGCGSSLREDDGDASEDLDRDPAEASVCAGIAGLPCEAGEYCNLGVGNCCCDFQGVCEVKPEACIALFDPVCGCDGETYSNSCAAAQAGVSIDFEGACEDR